MEWWSLGFRKPSSPSLQYSNAPFFLVILRQNIFRPKLHLAVQAVHGRIDDLEFKVLHAVFDEFIDAPAHVVDRAEDVAIEGELHAVDIPFVAFAASFQS